MGLASTADWRWWNVVESNNIRALDQDGDGAMDVALYHNTSAGTGSLTVLYGHPAGGLPDTSEAETTDLLYANGHYSLFSDVTGDGIPELVVSCGSEDRIKVFIGLRGQRLKEQYGDGHEGGHPGEPRWWGRPWAEVWQPVKINPNWFYAEHVLVDLGDGNLDGINDIWCISWPYLLCYSGGERMDSLVDGLLDLRPGKTVLSAARLGDIDGSGGQALAVSYDVAHSGASSFPGGIIFMMPSRAIPDSGTVRRLPHGTGRGSAGVEEPHPAGGQLHLSQRGE